MKLMGILNVTPDSFSDGGLYLDPERAVEHGRELFAEGADLVDVGGESTRPGAAAVGAEEERARVEPVVEALAATGPVSIDTSKAEVAEAAIGLGASTVNDVTAFRADPDLAALCAERGVDVVLMHMLGTPRTMQIDPRYDDVVAEVKSFLAERAEAAVAAGIEESRIWVDPGIGFGKTLDHNLELLANLDSLLDLGFPVLVGPSRKSFINKIDGSDEEHRLGGTIAVCLDSAARGAAGLRVHDVQAVRQALEVRGRIADKG